MSKRLSVIVVTHNSEESIARCIESIPQSARDSSYEVIVVDNHSRDRTLEVARRYEFAAIVQNDSNLGFATACNMGARKATGEYLLFLNPDAYLLNDAIDSIADCELEIGGNAIIGGRVISPDGKVTRNIRGFPSLLNVLSESFFLYKLFPLSKKFGSYYYTNVNHTEAANVDAVEGSFILIPRMIFEKLGGFDEDYFLYSEDTDLCYRAKKNLIPVVYFPGATAVHSGQGAAGKVSRRYILSMHLGQLKFIRRHFSGPEKTGTVLLKILGLLIRVPLYFIGSVVSLRVDLARKSVFYLETALRGIAHADVPRKLFVE